MFVSVCVLSGCFFFFKKGGELPPPPSLPRGPESETLSQGYHLQSASFRQDLEAGPSQSICPTRAHLTPRVLESSVRQLDSHYLGPLGWGWMRRLSAFCLLGRELAQSTCVLYPAEPAHSITSWVTKP